MTGTNLLDICTDVYTVACVAYQYFLHVVPTTYVPPRSKPLNRWPTRSLALLMSPVTWLPTSRPSSPASAVFRKHGLQHDSRAGSKWVTGAEVAGGAQDASRGVVCRNDGDVYHDCRSCSSVAAPYHLFVLLYRVRPRGLAPTDAWCYHSSIRAAGICNTGAALWLYLLNSATRPWAWRGLQQQLAICILTALGDAIIVPRHPMASFNCGPLSVLRLVVYPGCGDLRLGCERGEGRGIGRTRVSAGKVITRMRSGSSSVSLCLRRARTWHVRARVRLLSLLYCDAPLILSTPTSGPCADPWPAVPLRRFWISRAGLASSSAPVLLCSSDEACNVLLWAML